MNLTDITPGDVYRFCNSKGEELVRTILSADEKKVIYQRAEDEPGTVKEIKTDQFMRFFRLHPAKIEKGVFT